MALVGNVDQDPGGELQGVDGLGPRRRALGLVGPVVAQRAVSTQGSRGAGLTMLAADGQTCGALRSHLIEALAAAGGLASVEPLRRTG